MLRRQKQTNKQKKKWGKLCEIISICLEAGSITCCEPSCCPKSGAAAAVAAAAAGAAAGGVVAPTLPAPCPAAPGRARPADPAPRGRPLGPGWQKKREGLSVCGCVYPTTNGGAQK